MRGLLDEALSREKQYAEQVMSFNKQIADARRSLGDELRDLWRSTLSPAEAEMDKVYQANEKFSQAKRALAQGDYEQATALAKQTQSIMTDVFRTTASEANKWSAFEVIKEAGELSSKVLEAQKDKAKQSQQAAATDAEAITAKMKQAETDLLKFMDQLNAIPLERKVVLAVEEGGVGIDAIKESYYSIQDRTVTLTIVEQLVAAQSQGGPVLRLSGGGGCRRIAGWLSGYGGGDRRKALLEDGEYVHPKESTALYGLGFMELVRSRKLPVEAVQQLMSGMILPPITIPTMPQLAMAGGGAVSGSDATESRDVVDINFNVGARKVRLSGARDQVKNLVGALKELQRGL